ncbi:hypothetical protein [Epibacterium ulvae]|uniref:Uncharacterized protein n=1 Tax=Epibacterium ulvae TaxID=1156985 RepID=A0A1G5RDJ5_9RHOB|nr:hypothetical protein [Epibacterium ulvae]SCZ71840.1 hypothetical protein SAMN04488118_1139 [Epibacterium ulvae]
MAIRNRLRALSTVIKGMIIGAIAVTRASAAVAPPGPDALDEVNANWDQLRTELDQGALGGAETTPLPPELEDILALADLDQNIEFAVRTSYALVDDARVAALDARWLDTIISRGNSRQMAQYFAVRTSLTIAPPETGSPLNWWLWNAWGKGGGDCDG